jgi:hypothetical protein
VLLSNGSFVPHLIDGLMLDPDHPRKDSNPSVLTIIQRDFSECIQQISLFAPDALRTATGVIDALDELVDKAWSEDAKDCGRGALMQLCPERIKHEVQAHDDLHLMMSCKWLSVAISGVASSYCELHNNRPKTAETSAIRVS